MVHFAKNQTLTQLGSLAGSYVDHYAKGAQGLSVLRVEENLAGQGAPALATVVGALAVAQQARIFGTRFATLARSVVVNGAPGAVLRAPGQPTIVAGFTVVRDRITAIDLMADPAKLRSLRL